MNKSLSATLCDTIQMVWDAETSNLVCRGSPTDRTSRNDIVFQRLKEGLCQQLPREVTLEWTLRLQADRGACQRVFMETMYMLYRIQLIPRSRMLRYRLSCGKAPKANSMLQSSRERLLSDSPNYCLPASVNDVRESRIPRLIRHNSQEKSALTESISPRVTVDHSRQGLQSAQILGAHP